MEDKKLEKEKKEESEEEKPSTSTEMEKIIRVIGEDENIHSQPLYGTDALSSWVCICNSARKFKTRKFNIM